MTKDEKPLLFSLHEAVQPCRTTSIQGVSRVHPALVNVVAENYRLSDELYLHLIQGGVTYGEYARAKQQINANTNASITQLDQQIGSQLAQSHEYELAQRRQAAIALSAWAQNQQQLANQQQMINSINRPRQTRCSYMGNQLICNTQ